MLTNYDFKLLFEIYNHNGFITFKKQTIFKNKVSFYKSIQELKSKEFIIISSMTLPDNSDKRFCVYEITGQGIMLCKLLV